MKLNNKCTKQVKNPKWQDADQLAIIIQTCVAKELNQGLPGSNPASGQSGTRRSGSGSPDSSPATSLHCLPAMVINCTSYLYYHCMQDEFQLISTWLKHFLCLLQFPPSSKIDSCANLLGRRTMKRKKILCRCHEVCLTKTITLTLTLTLNQRQ